MFGGEEMRWRCGVIVIGIGIHGGWMDGFNWEMNESSNEK